MSQIVLNVYPPKLYKLSRDLVPGSADFFFSPCWPKISPATYSPRPSFRLGRALLDDPLCTGTGGTGVVLYVSIWLCSSQMSSSIQKE